MTPRNLATLIRQKFTLPDRRQLRGGIFFIAMIFSPLADYAQDWKEAYQLAVQHYNEESYEASIREAERAISLAGDDIKHRAYARQVLTAACVASGLYDRGLSEVGKEIDEFRELEPNGKNHVEALRKRAQLLMGMKRFSEAAASYHEALRCLELGGGGQSLEYFLAQADEAGALMQAEQYNEAQQLYGSALAKLRTIPEASDDYVVALFNSAYIDYTTHGEDAVSKLTELIGFLEHNDLKAYPQYDESLKMLSNLNVSRKDSTGFVLPADQARQLFEKAFAVQSDDPLNALKYYRSCEDVLEANALVNNTSYSCHLNYARLLYATRAYADAATFVSKAEDDALKLYGETSAEYGHVKILRGDLALHGHDVRTAASLYEDGVRLLMGQPADVLFRQIQWVCGQLIAAKADQEAIHLLEPVFASERYADFDVRSRILLQQMNGRAYLDASRAEDLIHYVRPLLDKEHDPDLKQSFLLLLAQAELDRGNPGAAAGLTGQGIALAPGGVIAGELYFEAARAYQRLGNYKDAEVNYQQALDHIVSSPSAATVMPLIFNSLAAFYIQLGNYAAAERFFLNLLATADGSPGFYNAVRQNLAGLYQQTGRYEKAKGLLLRTLESDKAEGIDGPDYAIALQNLASVYQKLHRLDSARMLYERALEIEERGGKGGLASATILANIGAVCQEDGNFTEARKFFERALAIRKLRLPPDHPDYAYGEYLLANLLYRTHNPSEALPLFKEAADYYVRQIHEVFPALSDAERTAFYNRVHEVISGYQGFLIENIGLGGDLPATLLNFRLETKALLLNSSLKVRNQILNSGDPDLVRDFNVWQHTKEQLAYLFSLTREERKAHADLIEEFGQKANELEKSLSLRSENFATAFVPREGDWRKVQESLKPGDAAIEIVRTTLQDSDSIAYAALVIRPDRTQPDVIIFDDGNFLERKGFSRYINSIRYQLEDPASYDLFWKKLEPVLAGVHTVYLSPDGIYTKINCATLYDPKTKQYLLDKLNVMLVSNLLDVIPRGEEASLPPHALLVGFPDYRLDAKAKITDFPATDRDVSTFARILQNGLPALPGTEKEVKDVQAILEEGKWNVETITGRDAREEEVKEDRSLTLLHIATHGFFIASEGSGKEVYSNDLRDMRNNVMLRSGLLLAGAEKNLIDMLSGASPTQSDDGVLTAYEVMNLNLDAVDLVVLSACETGVGDVKNGEGVYGLQRAFMLAGARHVLMSLWKVDDSATQELMTRFYREWSNGRDKVEAFREAQLNIKRKFGHPYYWGAFVMAGR